MPAAVASSSATTTLVRLREWELLVSPRVEQAAALAERLYEGRMHWTGVTLLAHALAVLETLKPFRPDPDTTIACLLQHALSTRGITLTELEEEFGVGVRQLVSSVHLLSHVTVRTRQTSIEDLRLMLLSVSEDPRVLLLILCERTSVLASMQHVTQSERRRVCRDILNLYAPVAARLGIHSLKQRMENLAFPVVYPLDYEWITDQLRQLQERHQSFLPQAAVLLKAALQEQGIASEIYGREKHPYSIFMKMKAKSRSSVTSLPDLYALRVIVGSEEDCYRVLGMLHRMARPVANRFKDYIAFPKPNGYRSLHTTITRLPGVPESVLMEVQIRTASMHAEAEYGIAAHWSYKEGGGAERAMQRVQVQRALTSQQTVMTKGEASVFADHIFVLTPKGDIIELPEGATPLDFAFQIHTDLGLSFRGARVNGRIVPMDYELENGDVIEIQTQPVPQPSPEWLKLVKMASSRSRLRRYLHTFHRAEYVAQGRAMMNEELRRRHLPPLDTDLTLLRSVRGKPLNITEREDLLAKLAQGADRMSVVLSRIDLLKGLLLGTVARRTVRAPRTTRSPVEIEGGLPMPVRFAKCCKPEADRTQKIVGIVRRGDVTVHAAKCRMVVRGNPERRITVRWKD